MMKIRTLVVDDEPVARARMLGLLSEEADVEVVGECADGSQARAAIEAKAPDLVFLDVQMPHMSGVDLATAFGPAQMPAVVFVTAYDDRAAEAFDMGVADYVRKPVQADRIAESLRRVLASRLVPTHPAVVGLREREDDPTIPVELAGTTRMLHRSAVQWVEAQGDYARLHTVDGSHLVRISLATLAERWAEAGFVRIHRSYLVQLKLIGELRLTGGGYVVIIGGRELPVSRRHTRELKDRLVRAAKQSWTR